VRYLIDADRIVFTDQGMAYRLPDGSLAPIRYDQYDHAASKGVRQYEFNGSRSPFHDIGQVRTGGNDTSYEFYALTGAKMWITNGSLATQFCLYAQTTEGVTGFMVDRYAEGLRSARTKRKPASAVPQRTRSRWTACASRARPCSATRATDR